MSSDVPPLHVEFDADKIDLLNCPNVKGVCVLVSNGSAPEWESHKYVCARCHQGWYTHSIDRRGFCEIEQERPFPWEETKLPQTRSPEDAS